MHDIRTLLSEMGVRGASDLYLTADSPPVLRIEGITENYGDEILTAPEVEELANAVMTERQRATFEERLEMNLALASGRLGRFRVNVFRQRGAVAVVIRQIKTQIPSIDELCLPAVLKRIVLSRRGLVLVTGATGSGKSTTQAAMIDYRNDHTRGHIVTIEDPIEFVHPHKHCLISQREVGFDTVSFSEALRNTLRQAPDLILIGEVRDLETMEAAITFAETGHLCVATLHSNNANQAIERVMNFFPAMRHPEIFLQLSLNLRAIISQRLVQGVDGKRVAGLEILIDTPRIRDLIKKGEVDVLKDAMQQSMLEGGQTFDQALYDLYAEGRITEEHALANADSANNLRIRIKNLDLREAAKADAGKPSRHSKPDKDDLRIEGVPTVNVRRL
ncbi:MAG: PilT/PilU family type 4a pilus ATPase [Deltaproteobacteria bacterium]|nr:PilT/PilU family type 4a pilus ATPase [Deltaproteobacteria bacterium]MBI3388663.1 PilT/PilU family type 4a pilus ATPase [Deltaproteobacteria bacterium]